MSSTFPYEPDPNSRPWTRRVLWSLQFVICLPAPDQLLLDFPHSSICFSSRISVDGTRCHPSSFALVSAITTRRPSRDIQWGDARDFGIILAEAWPNFYSKFVEKCACSMSFGTKRIFSNIEWAPCGTAERCCADWGGVVALHILYNPALLTRVVWMTCMNFTWVVIWKFGLNWKVGKE